ncbi:MAG: hypothetical protein RL037_1727 [Bacteroidota bacterium]|jgi:superoxide dismutase
MKSSFLSVFVFLFIFYASAQPFTLPSLRFEYSAYEPHIDAQTMEIHLTKHHQGYVNNLNKAINGTKLETYSMNQLLLNASLRSDMVRNNAGGHYNHSLFWQILAPEAKQGNMTDELKNAIDKEFKLMDSLKSKLGTAAAKHFGSGWAWLIVTPDKKLKVTSTSNQDNPIMDVVKDRGIPILAVDVWEHAYYLKYQNKRADYLNNIWNLIDWQIVSANYIAALNDPLLKEIEDDSWPEIKDFHKVMSQTFHPAEKDDFIPLQARSGEMRAKSLLLYESVIPSRYQKPEVKANLLKLVKECEELDKLVKKNAKKIVLKAKIIQAHDTFHVIQGLCKD